MERYDDFSWPNLETIVESKLAVSVMNQTVLALYEEIMECQERLSGWNETLMKQDEIMQVMKERLENLQLTCYGKNKLHPEQCSGHGYCVDVDHCVCEDDWFGNQCHLGRLTWNEIVSENGPGVRSNPTLVGYQGSLWLFGGPVEDDAVESNDLWQYRVSNHSWLLVDMAPRPSIRYVHSAVVYQDAMWVFGGTEEDQEDKHKNDLWAFNFTSTSWMEIFVSDPKPSPRRAHSAVIYHDAMWVFGGFEFWPSFLNDFWQFDFMNSIWVNETIAPAPDVRFGHSAVIYEDAMWIFGGSSMSIYGDAWKLNFTSSLWNEVYHSGAIPYIHFSVAVVYQDAMWTFGGRDADEEIVNYQDQVSKFLFAENSWETITVTGSVPNGRMSHAGAVHQGMLWIFGGHSTSEYNDFWKFVLL